MSVVSYPWCHHLSFTASSGGCHVSQWVNFLNPKFAFPCWAIPRWHPEPVKASIRKGHLSTSGHQSWCVCELYWVAVGTTLLVCGPQHCNLDTCNMDVKYQPPTTSIIIWAYCTWHLRRPPEASSQGLTMYTSHLFFWGGGARSSQCQKHVQRWGAFQSTTIIQQLQDGVACSGWCSLHNGQRSLLHGGHPICKMFILGMFQSRSLQLL